MGPTWALSPPDGPHVGPMNFAIRGCNELQDIVGYKKCNLSNDRQVAYTIMVTAGGIFNL